MQRPYRFITNDTWIDGLPEHVQNDVNARMSRVTFRAGREVRRAGTVADCMSRIEEGYLRLTGLHSDGRRSLIAIYARGTSFGETALVAGRAYNHTTYALVDTVVSELPAADFWNLYRRHPEIPEALCRKFARLIARQITAREMRATLRLGQRIAMLFQDLARDGGIALEDGSTRLDVPLTQSDIAELFDVTRQSVQREVTHLKELSILEKRAGSWLIADPRRLAYMI